MWPGLPGEHRSIGGLQTLGAQLTIRVLPSRRECFLHPLGIRRLFLRLETFSQAEQGTPVARVALQVCAQDFFRFPVLPVHQQRAAE